MRLFVASLVLGGVLILSCGKNGGGGTGGNPPPVKGAKVNLYLFAAPWCIPCQHEIAAVRDTFKNDPKASRLLVTIYTPSGNKPSDPPTQETANAFQASMQVNYTMALDSRCKTTYAQYFPDTPCAIPASVVLSEDLKTVLKSFPPSDTDNTAALIDSIKTYLQ